jgi:hypothetical protein
VYGLSIKEYEMRRLSIFLITLLIALTLSWYAACAVEKNDAILSLSLPNLTWGLEISAQGFIVQQAKIASSGRVARLLAANEATGMILSAILEPAATVGGPRECRDYYWNRMKDSPFNKEQIKMYESVGLSVVEYVIPEFRGVRVNQKNIYAYLVEGGYWIEVHISKNISNSEREDPMLAVLKSIRINKSIFRSSRDYFLYGSMYYRSKNYKDAALQYEKALELEKRAKLLGPDIWKVLVDQLGMSFGISGELTKAKALFEWAITQEPEYPMFYYNLACTFAEMGNQEQTLKNLRMAYKYKGNMIYGEDFPDPKQDSSFSKYMQDKDFIAEMGKLR